jgi:hypothetical protein
VPQGHVDWGSVLQRIQEELPSAAHPRQEQERQQGEAKEEEATEEARGVPRFNSNRQRNRSFFFVTPSRTELVERRNTQ